MIRLRGLIWGMAAFALAIGSPARAACHDGRILAAARLHEFHVRLSVAELRCGALDPDFTLRINSYAARYATALGEAEALLRPVVADLAGGERRAFEAYAASLANRYGRDSASPTFCGVLNDMLVQLTAPAGSLDDLHTYALLLVRQPLLATRCPAVLSAR